MADADDVVDVLPPATRRVFTNRTLNLRSIAAIGFDMDYTLIHYAVEAWERHAFAHLKERLAVRDWPVDGVEFDPSMVALGLILDLHHGNVVKANRFGYVKRAAHGTRLLDFPEQKRLYARDQVDLADRGRWVFLNTQFSLSEACMYSHMVDRLDEGRFANPALGYATLYRDIRASLDEAHMEGRLKAEIVADPDRFVVLDPDAPLALLDLKHAGKQLLLITNSEWRYTKAMMAYAFDAFLPEGMTWRDVFDMVIVSARKPSFFEHPNPVFEVIDDAGRLLPRARPERGGTYLGGNATAVEEALGLAGDKILYVGDHIFSDVRVSQSLQRWRTALVVRSLEEELDALEAFRPHQEQLTRLMADKTLLEHRLSRARLAAQRQQHGYGPAAGESREVLQARIDELKARLEDLDQSIVPLAVEAGQLVNPRWGLLLRTGNDKSHLARQIERYADVYTSRVSNLLEATPFAYLRSPRGSLPHDHGPGGGVS
ncbi:MAG: HAD-IG family 5'-nucleotidase [Sandaracinaceae bacterium]